MIAVTVAFVVYIAVAGLGNASELAGVVSALIAVAGLGLTVFGVASASHQNRTLDSKDSTINSIETTQGRTDRSESGRSGTKHEHSATHSKRRSVTRTETLRTEPKPSAAKTKTSVMKSAIGTPPWTVRGYGLIYSVINVTRSMSKWEGEEGKPSITVTADVTSTELSDDDFHSLEYTFSDQETGVELDMVPFASRGRENQALNQRSRLITVLWDGDPHTTTLTITLHDFYWPARKNLILKDVPVPPMR
jgi:hypothetical protein